MTINLVSDRSKLFTALLQEKIAMEQLVSGLLRGSKAMIPLREAYRHPQRMPDYRKRSLRK